MQGEGRGGFVAGEQQERGRIEKKVHQSATCLFIDLRLASTVRFQRICSLFPTSTSGQLVVVHAAQLLWMPSRTSSTAKLSIDL